MKNITLFVAALIFVVPTYAKWGTNCTSNGGTIIKANEYGTKDGENLDKGGLCNDPSDPNLTNNCNGMEFCLSNKDMNWWSAFTWCESVGGHLVSFERLCPGTPMVENRTNGACANIVGIGGGMYPYAWTATGWGTQQVLHPFIGGGIVVYVQRTASDLTPFCVER